VQRCLRSEPSLLIWSETLENGECLGCRTLTTSMCLFSVLM